MAASLPEAKVYDYFNKRTFEEISFDNKLRELIEANSEGLTIDFGPIVSLLPCFGIDENSVKTSISQRQLRLSFKFS